MPKDLSYTIGGQTKTLPWGDGQEQQFQQDMRNRSPYADWSRQFQQKYNAPPNLDDPQYNYRLAYALGAEPEPYAHDGGAYHWTSSAPVAPYAEPADLKGANHSTKWMETFMREYGVDPFEAGAEQLQDAVRRGIVPMADNGVSPRSGLRSLGSGTAAKETRK